MTLSDIEIRGAREHNLRNVSLQIPRNKLVVMTGVSGSGKSSLAFDTLYAEGQRRYVESLSTYARQFLGQMPKPDVDSISGLAPSISIQQKSTSRNPRSTVGTITEVYDYLRVLFARVGQGYCYVSGKPIRAQSTDQIVESIAGLEKGTKFQILAPLVQNQKGEFRDLFTDLMKKGYLRARVDGELISLANPPSLKRHHKHTIEVVVDRLIAGTTGRSRLAEAVEQALKLGDSRLICSVSHTSGRAISEPVAGLSALELAAEDAEAFMLADSDRLYSALYACSESGISYEPPSPQLFSFNSPLGMCPDCNGLGLRHGFPETTLVADESLTIMRGAMLLLDWKKMGRWPRHLLQGAANAIEEDCGLAENTLLKTRWSELPPDAQQLWLYGTGDRHVTFSWRTRGGVRRHGGTWEGWANRLLESWRSAANPMRRRQLEKYMEVVACAGCRGERLNRQARHVRIRTASKTWQKQGGAVELSLPQLCSLSVEDAAEFLSELQLSPVAEFIAEEVLREIRGRLRFLLQCGLNYLALDRSAPTLSGGESQRIRLAGQIGCGLTGVVYILDEPSIGLHPRDNAMLLGSLEQLRDQGNTVIVVEHDEETMRAADHIVDFGPGPGVLGGEVVVEGSLNDVLKSKRSITGQYLSGRLSIETPAERRSPERGSLVIRGASHNNLKNVTASFPLGRLIGVTGVSGSGKSSLVNDILWQVVNRDVNGGKGTPGSHKSVDGLDLIDRAIDIDQSPIGRTPRSNPATYVKVLDEIRKLFAGLPQSKARGYREGRFSFNVADGRCEACDGHGATKLEMDFLADIWVPCNVCEGRRFNHETLEVCYKDHSIADVLNLETRDALSLFENLPKIARLLQALVDVGLDYMRLGQPSPTLSGGEAQRIKLARELGKRSTGKTLYLLDEPTTGLHFADVRKLLEVLQGLVDAGNTVIVIEHNLDVIRCADWLLDIGPEGGAGGGTLLVEGTPEDVAACRDSRTGEALRAVLPGFSRRRTKKAAKPAPLLADPFATQGTIRVSGASQHNLQKIDLEIPREKMSVFCGPSGSGKTSLAMDTLYAEGQRRYVESLSAYARQFLGQMPKPRVESIQGLSPAIAIEQKTVGATPRSTVGTVTEIYDYLRVLYARLGQIHCPDCQQPVRQQTTDQIVEAVSKFPRGTRLLLTAPLQVDHTTPWKRVWEKLQAEGFVRVRIDGKTVNLSDAPALTHRRSHSVSVVVDRVTAGRGSRTRTADSVESALDVGRGVMDVVTADPDRPEPKWAVRRFSLHLSCEACQRGFEPLVPQSFSFNSPLGWCHSCEGLGREYGANQSLLITSPELSLLDGAVGAYPVMTEQPAFRLLMTRVCAAYGIEPDQPWYLLTASQQRRILYGDTETWVTISAADLQELSGSDRDAVSGADLRIRYRGLYPAIEAASRLSYSYRQQLAEMAGERDCSDCCGSRLQDTASFARLRERTLPQVCRMPLSEALRFLDGLKLNRDEKKIAGDLLNEAVHRLRFLVDVGLEYLNLDRSMPTLSGGESQRIRLAGQVGRSLTGVLYVLDEPTIGLHPRDNHRLLDTLKRLRDLGNTVLLVEHDRDVLAAADRLYDFGPGAGRLGGQVVAAGTPRQLQRQTQKSMTGAYLSGTRSIPLPSQRRVVAVPDPDHDVQPRVPAALHQAVDAGGDPVDCLELLGAAQHNLRNVDLQIPLGTLTCIAGVSGSGKSSLIMDTLGPAVAKKLNRANAAPGKFRALHGVEFLSGIVVVNQSPIGSTPASNPATYTGFFDQIRELFCRMPEARVRGYRPARFSFNRPGGRCDDCEGMGQQKIEMHFLPDVWVECNTCKGRRFNEETLAVRFNGYTIADVLELSIGKALEVFASIPKIRTPLATLSAIGLDYLTLGQSAPTLSGGEAQRIKLAAELCRPGRGSTLYLLDEPTTGLHFDDILKLLAVLNSLVQQGNTVVVIEHNPDVIKTADWVIDIGPEAGSGGGRITAQGTPEVVAARGEWAAKQAGKKTAKGRSATTKPDRSWTGEILVPVLRESVSGEIETFDIDAVAEKQEQDLSVEQIGRTIQLPWVTDGKQWHLHDRVAHSGKACQWDGAALEYVTDLLAENQELREASWGDRSTVEVRGVRGTGWLLHARTGGEWLLSLCFRVKKGAFTHADLDADLGLLSLDEMTDLPVYGHESRVKVRNLRSGWQEVTIKVWNREEIDTDEFRAFLEQAVTSYLSISAPEAQKSEELLPWKKLGRRWHLMRKGLPAGGRIGWDFGLLEELLPITEKGLSKLSVDYTVRSKINWHHAKSGRLAAELHTRRADCAELTLHCQPGKVTLGAVSAFGESSEVVAGDDSDTVRLKFRTIEQAQSSDLAKFLSRIGSKLVNSRKQK
jgi:excinuclease ABC subunit A